MAIEMGGVFFLDLPGEAEKEAIWRMHRDRFGVPVDQPKPDDGSFTGAEIRACCRLAVLLDLPLREAARQIVPVATTAAEGVEKLRQWADGRCLSAEAPGVYRRQGSAAAGPQPKRRIRTDPTLN